MTICNRDAERSVFSILECPNCGSGNITCRASRTEHHHRCDDCGTEGDLGR